MTSLRTCGIGGNSLCFRENLVRRDRRGGGPMLGSLNRGAQGRAQGCWLPAWPGVRTGAQSVAQAGFLGYGWGPALGAHLGGPLVDPTWGPIWRWAGRLVSWGHLPPHTPKSPRVSGLPLRPDWLTGQGC